MAEVHHKTVFDAGLQHLGQVYAKALLGATEKAGNSEPVIEELDSLVREVLDVLPNLEATLSSPKVPPDAKLRILDRAFGGKASRELLNLLKILCHRNRFRCIRAIQHAARQQLNELRGRVQVLARSAEPLQPDAIELVRQRLQVSLGKDIDLQVDVDPELIGGLVLKVGDTVYDGSIVNRLANLREGLLAKAGQQIRGQLSRFASAD